jgi:plastocyanin
MRHQTTSRRVAAVRLAALAAMVLATGGAATAGPGDTAVTIKNFDFHPMAIAVPAGATVTWKNLDGEPHTITSTDGAFRSQALDEGDTFSFRFAKPGVYKYICTIHPRMVASVTVK